MRLGYAAAALTAVLFAGSARAGASACWIENGVLLAPAVAAGVNGVFVLDTGQAHTQLDATQASEADIAGAAIVAPVIFAGRTVPRASLQVAPLDERTRRFPTPIAGVLGADVLAGRVLTVRPDPCRLTLTRGNRHMHPSLPIVLRGGAPYVAATISDGRQSLTGLFRIDTGSPAALTLTPAAAALAPARRLRALSLDRRLFEDQVTVAGAADEGVLGAIGEPIWSQFEMRLDLKRRTLQLKPPSRP